MILRDDTRLLFFLFKCKFKDEDEYLYALLNQNQKEVLC